MRAIVGEVGKINTSHLPIASLHQHFCLEHRTALFVVQQLQNITPERQLFDIDRTRFAVLLEDNLFVMCTYGRTYAVKGECTRQPQHKIETRLRKRCSASPKPGPPCGSPTYDSSLDQLNSRKGGPCTACRDSGVAVEVYEIKWVSQKALLLLLMCKPALTNIRWIQLSKFVGDEEIFTRRTFIGMQCLNGMEWTSNWTRILAFELAAIRSVLVFINYSMTLHVVFVFDK